MHAGDGACVPFWRTTYVSRFADSLVVSTGTENKNRYVFATQSLPLRESLRAVPGSPIIYIARSVMLLESPSNQTLAKKRRVRFASRIALRAALLQPRAQPSPLALYIPY